MAELNQPKAPEPALFFQAHVDDVIILLTLLLTLAGITGTLAFPTWESQTCLLTTTNDTNDMRAVLIKDGKGPVDNLYLGETETPTPGPGKVLIKVHTISIILRNDSQSVFRSKRSA